MGPKRNVRWGRRVGFIIGLTGIAGAPLSAQQMVGGRLASRAELETRLDSLQRAAAATNGDEDRELLNQIGALSYRLREGDVWPGDVVDLQVTGQDKWTGQFTVTPNRQIELVDIDPISAAGVLYSELEQKISSQLARYLREPRVRVEVLKRIGVLGSVTTPGFYMVKGSSLVSEVIMQAGGPAQDADVDEVKFRRLGDEIQTGRPRVAWQSLSLDQLGVRSGDELYVPQDDPGVGRLLLGALAIATSIGFLIVRVF
ncbi:MAG: polysaccharide biosynthesis/export family protein [Gemmatimonadota bacterium]